MQNSLHPTISSINKWWLAIRPRTLPAAMAGVITGSALAFQIGKIRILPAIAALFVALLLQIGSNLANDVFDFERGADSGPRLGPVRVTQSGLLSPRQVKKGMIVIFALAAILGLYLALVTSWKVIPIGMAAILAAITYTGGPYPLGYHGLGELFVFVFFGIVSVTGTYYVQVGHVSTLAWAMSLPVGAIIVGILVVNNLRDLELDRIAGKHTLAARFGPRFAKIEYIGCLGIAYLSIPTFSLLNLLSWEAMLTWASIPIALQATKIILAETGKPLNKALAKTGQLALIFSLFFFAGTILVPWVIK